MSGLEGLLIGRVVGDRYRIEEVIGRGGMAAVYRATDERLGREVALKVMMPPGGADLDAQTRLENRFFREARSAAALPHHPNIVPVYDYGRDEALSIHYLVMELLRGSDLASRLAQSGPPPLAASLKILIEAARGLAVGHRLGLVHRDVKPANIFLTQTHNNEIQVRVVDFGIAKVTDDADTLSQLTQDGRIPHSPAYASPEQLRGLGHFTPASDVFSLGAVGFQLLTGERPFSESDRNKISLGMPVQPPSIRDRNPAVPASVEAVIRRALSYEPHDRFADAGEMVSELEHAMRTIGETPLDPYLGGAPIVTASDDKSDDETQLVDVTADPRRSEAAEGDRTLLAPPVRPSRGSPAATSLPPRRYPPGREEKAKRGVGEVLVWALVFAVLAIAGIWGLSEITGPRVAEEIPPAPDSIPVILPPATVDTPPEATELDAVINNNDGLASMRAGRYEDAARQFNRAVEISPNNAEYRRNFALALLRLERIAEAERELQRAIQLDPLAPLPYMNLAETQLARGDTISAIASIGQYLERETNPVLAGRADRLRQDLQTDIQPPIPLLGDTVIRTPPPQSSPPTDTGPAEANGGRL